MNHHYKSRLLPFIGFITYTFCMCVFALSSFLAVDSVCLKVNSSIDLMVWIWGLKTESKKIPLGRAKTKVSLWRSSSVFDVSFKNGIKDYIKVSSERRKFPHFICNISSWAHKSSWQNISSYLHVAALLFHKHVYALTCPAFTFFFVLWISGIAFP